MPATLHDNPTLSRFEMDDDGILAVANYRLADNVMTLTHTEVPPQPAGMALLLAWWQACSRWRGRGA